MHPHLGLTGAVAMVVIIGGAALAAAPPTTIPDERAAARQAMVTEQLIPRGVKDKSVLEAMRQVPRHEFVPEAVRAHAHDDRPLPIGLDQTISQPYIVALMSELARVGRGSRVLEVGTGSGYQAAVLAHLGAEVYSIEIVAPLARRAAETLARLGYKSVKTRTGDGYQGWAEAAPFDAILVTAAPDHVPEPLIRQLRIGGRMVIPVGRAGEQDLKVLTRTKTGVEERMVIPVRFVPMTGRAASEPVQRRTIR